MRRALMVALLSLLAVLSLRADDFGTWHFVQATKSLGQRGAYVGFRAEYRDCNNLTATDRWFLRPFVGYRFTPWLKGELIYDFMRKGTDTQIHQGIVGLIATLREGPLSVTVRERYQYLYNATAGTSRNYIRSYLKTAYAVPDSRLTPYLAVELFTWESWKLSRHFAGTAIRLSPNCSLDAFYMYHTFVSQEPRHVLGLGCNIAL